jgi:hypothetical protein
MFQILRAVMQTFFKKGIDQRIECIAALLVQAAPSKELKHSLMKQGLHCEKKRKETSFMQ